MATLIVEVNDDKLKMVKDVLKAIGVTVNKKIAKTPNETTVQAIKEARNGKVIKVKELMNV